MCFADINVERVTSMMAPYHKGIPRKGMRQQLRGDKPKAKSVRTDQRRRHGKDLLEYRYDNSNRSVRRHKPQDAHLA